MKKFLSFYILVLSCCFVFPESNIEKFVKGNISDKTAAVRNATGDEVVWLSNRAINFVLESKEILGNDRELDGLAVAAILSFPSENVKNVTDTAKEIIINNFINLFEVFSNSTTVQTAIISKISTFKDVLNISPLIKVLNKYISNTDLAVTDSDVINSILNLFISDGDSESFLICYRLWESKKYPNLTTLLENVMISRLIVSMNEVIPAINNLSPDNLAMFFNMLIKNKLKINQNYLSEIAENVLSNTILLVKNSQKTTGEITNLQIQALTVLSENKWTRASSVVLSFFEYAKDLYEKNELSEDDLVLVINSLNNVSPLEAVPPLVSYLGELNSRAEKKQEISEPVVLAVINTLGAIGDKSAFDALLGITYFSYSQPILSAAREALSGLKW